ncbi:hypothetical protein [Kineosporia sp. NBRC 101731]|uniref:hypothetical protein n=1 Tax=Kineosporia sp. NBRC 101731 TaxID=3032199 RepID=UPI0024A170F2|nr:hypothetical protein [Kineosporia sp. NBRC 101731]GLY28909.1 hypothetical protein Kisp02_22740 [Kineosporia sp. NBRC 101731]
MEATSAGSVSQPAGSSDSGGDGDRSRLYEKYDLQYVLDTYEREGGLRLALPVGVPENTEFLGFLTADKAELAGGGQAVVSRSAWFDTDQGTVTVCAEKTNADGEWCPESNVGITIEEDGVLRTVHIGAPTEGPANQSAEWSQAKYSADPREWSWLKQ